MSALRAAASISSESANGARNDSSYATFCAAAVRLGVPAETVVQDRGRQAGDLHGVPVSAFGELVLDRGRFGRLTAGRPWYAASNRAPYDAIRIPVASLTASCSATSDVAASRSPQQVVMNPW